MSAKPVALPAATRLGKIEQPSDHMTKISPYATTCRNILANDSRAARRDVEELLLISQERCRQKYKVDDIVQGPSQKGKISNLIGLTIPVYIAPPQAAAFCLLKSTPLG